MKGVSVMFLGARNSCRLILFAIILLSQVACFSADEPAAAEQSKLYSPFDEKSPKMPAEFAGDKRLDVKVDIAVKSKNMKDLFADLRKATGVNVVVAKELSGERPIVFFHGAPLRDVMTEISVLYGYFWLAKGQKDAWTYELFEDLVHAKRREQVRNDQEAAQVDALMKCIDMCTEVLGNDAALERLRQTNPRLYASATVTRKRAVLNVVRQIDRGFLRTLVNDLGMGWDFPKLSPEMQAGVVDFVNMGPGGTPENFPPVTADSLGSSRVQIKRWRASVFTPPHLILIVHFPAKADGTGGMKLYEDWPAYQDGEPDLLSMAEQPAGKVTGDPLSKDVKITVEKKYEVFHYGAILAQDVLEAIAKQANLNVIADYYYQETPFPLCEDEPLDKFVRDACLKMDYSCQVEGNTIRFRCNKWFLQPLQEEPPMTLQEHWWRRIFETGGLSLEDLVDIANLRGRQTFWGGFRFIPQAYQARLFPTTARIVRTLGPALEDQAGTPEGLAVSRLSSEQLAKLEEWGRVMGVREKEVLMGSVIRIEKSGVPVDLIRFMLTLPDGKIRTITMTARVATLSEEDRRTLAEERAAELAADKVELSAEGK